MLTHDGTAAGRSVRDPASRTGRSISRLLLPSPLGPLLAEYGEDGVHALGFWPQGEHPPAGTRDAPAPDDVIGRTIATQLAEYFSGTRRAFDLPLAPSGTPFQQRVWQALAAIPFGEVRSYAQLADAAGCPGGARAVGQANARNPIPLIVPCHRVTAASGELGGFSAGLDRKRWLLRHEGAAVR
jgi:methylated-DNA-[protein]-cysteine S-methyltransferase